MAAQRYEIFLRVLKNISRVSGWNIFNTKREKRNFVSPSGHVMFYLSYKHQWNTKLFQWNSFFPAKGSLRGGRKKGRETGREKSRKERKGPFPSLPSPPPFFSIPYPFRRLLRRLAKGAIYYVAIATVIFSHMKITCYFHVWRYHVFARKLTWYIFHWCLYNKK